MWIGYWRLRKDGIGEIESKRTTIFVALNDPRRRIDNFRRVVMTFVALNDPPRPITIPEGSRTTFISAGDPGGIEFE